MFFCSCSDVKAVHTSKEFHVLHNETSTSEEIMENGELKLFLLLLSKYM